ncbi:MAG TPA: pyridoxine 5'-phosphate synthase, partial [Phycisphaerae bacterium]
ADEIVEIACRIRPDQCTLVPERREEITTEGGLDVIRQRLRVQAAVRRLREQGIVVSAFIEPIEDQVRASADIGFHAVELWTGAYAHARSDSDIKSSLDALSAAIAVGCGCGLHVHAGHGLTYRNVPTVAALPGFEEFNIGHAIVARALFVGMREAVAQMKMLLVQHAPREGTG